MRFLIIGSGSMGCVIGWALQNAGHDVKIYIRPGALAQKPKHITILNIDQRAKKFRSQKRIFEPKYVEEISVNDDYDFILAPIKHYQWSELIPVLSKISNNSIIVTLGNLWEEFNMLHDAFGDRLVHGFFHFTSALKGDECHGFISSNVSLGTSEAHQKQISQLDSILRDAGFHPKIRADMKSWLICHFAFNASFISAATVAGGLGNLIKSAKHIQLMQKLNRESFAVVKARGINPADYPDQSGFGKMPWPFLVILIKLLSFTTPLQVALQHSHIDGKEIKSYYFDLLKTAMQCNVSTPVFDSIKDMMTAIDDRFHP